MLTKSPDPELCEAAEELHKVLGKHIDMNSGGAAGDGNLMLLEESDEESAQGENDMDESK